VTAVAMSRRRWTGEVVRAVGALVAAMMVAVAVIAVAHQIRGSASPSLSERRTSEARYEDAIAGPAREGGFVIQEGLKLGLTQLGAGQSGNVMFQAVGWVNQLSDVRSRFAAAAHGLKDPTLRAAAAKFDQALDLYRQTAETIGAAAVGGVDPATRSRLLEQASGHGRDADARYDDASRLLQQARRSLGLAPTNRFPDPQ